MADYLSWLRQRVGRQKVLLVFASACVRDEAGRVLWQRRSDFGWWGLPGGVLELDESLPQCVVREVREETGLTVTPERLVGVYSSPDYQVVYPNGDQVQQVTACFECRPLGGELRPGVSETLDLAWFPLDEPPSTAPWYEAMAADLAAGGRGASFRRGGPGERPSGASFFSRMREHIGQEPLILPAAGALVRDDAGRVLLARRRDTGEWSLPGGAMELGERIDRTAVAEVREEVGLEVEPIRLIGVHSDPGCWTYPHGDQIKVVSVLFEGRAIGGRLRPDGAEMVEARFFRPEELPPMGEWHARRVGDGLAGRVEAVF
jgi:ADP-ribose pyrophosphatase YjhB (NUDIX family)